MHIVYLIQHDISKDMYIGRTRDLKRRLHQHNSQGTHSTARSDGKWILVYAEAYRNKEDGIDRETKLKQHGSSKKGLKMRIKRSLL